MKVMTPLKASNGAMPLLQFAGPSIHSEIDKIIGNGRSRIF
jgi:hypothetical protein